MNRFWIFDSTENKCCGPPLFLGRSFLCRALKAPTEPQEQAKTETPDNQATYSCPQDGCSKVFQRYSAMERHLLYGKCISSPDRGTLLDRAMEGYAERLTEGVGSIPSLAETTPITMRTTQNEEGWALKQTHRM